MGVCKMNPKDMVARPFDYSKLRGRIREKYGKEGAFAEALGISPKSLSDWLNNKKYWKHEFISVAIELLEIPDSEVGAYFFTRLVQTV